MPTHSNQLGHEPLQDADDIVSLPDILFVSGRLVIACLNSPTRFVSSGILADM